MHPRFTQGQDQFKPNLMKFGPVATELKQMHLIWDTIGPILIVMMNKDTYLFWFLTSNLNAILETLGALINWINCVYSIKFGLLPFFLI